jgi:hypothetical protein
VTQFSSKNQADVPRIVTCPDGDISCIVTAADGLNVRNAPNTNATILFTAPQGRTLCFSAVVQGQEVEGNSNWGAEGSPNPTSFFWLGGTDHSNG